MPAPVRVDSGFASHRKEMRGSLNRVLENRKSYLRFVLGMAATLVVAFAALSYWLVKAGALQM